MANINLNKPWYNMFPHSNYSQFNLDWLIAKYGEYDQRIQTLEEAVADHEERLKAAENDIDALEDRMDTAEADIDALEGRMDTAEGDISDLKDRMQTAEGDIDSLEGRMDLAEGDIDDLEAVVGDANSGLVKDVTDIKSDIQTINGDINTINLKDQSQDNDIGALGNRVTTLENNAVVANPGGTGSNLNSVQISGVTYLIPSGGGGGGGSSVTPNPAGAVTSGDLTKIDIDGDIYGIHDYSSAIGDVAGDVSALDTRVETLEDSVGNVGTRTVSFAVGDLTNNNQVQEIVSTEFTIPDGEQDIIIAHCDIDTSNFGSTPRYLGFYLREFETGTTYSNNCLTKFSIRGDEPSMITSAANMQLTQRVGPGTYRFAVRCHSTATQSFHYNIYADIITIRENPNV